MNGCGRRQAVPEPGMRLRAGNGKRVPGEGRRADLPVFGNSDAPAIS